MSFHVGQKVERVSGTSDRIVLVPPFGETVTVANVYTISCCCGLCGNSVTMIEIAEYPAPACELFAAGFVAEHFRPVIERKTDISIFTEMLPPTVKPKQLVDA